MDKKIDENVLREMVIDFARKKKAELEPKGKEWMGVYHNGIYGSKSPKRDVMITRHSEGKIHIKYCCNYQMWNWVVDESLLTPPADV